MPVRAFLGESFISILNFISAFTVPRRFSMLCRSATRRIDSPDFTACQNFILSMP